MERTLIRKYLLYNKYSFYQLGLNNHVNLCTSSARTKLGELVEKFSGNKTIEAVNYGQPTSNTHPHLIKSHEFVPGLTLEEFKTRRSKLVQKIIKSSNGKKHCVIVPSARKKYMSGKIPYVFRQNSDFMYLTGCLEPESVLVMEIQNESCTSSMFLRPKDKNMEMWDGAVTGLGEGASFFGVDQAIDISDLSNYLASVIKSIGPDTIWYDREECEFKGITSTMTDLSKLHTANVLSPTNLIHQLRLYKSEAEQKLMEKTCQIASESINETIKWVKPNMSEHLLFAKVDYECRIRNASYLSYPPVVASGANSTTIHYISNNQVIQNGDTILMDAGCEYGSYTSDITRTFPANGKFSDAQRVLYEICLAVQKNLIKTLNETDCSLDQLFEVMCLDIGKYLKEINFIPKHLSGLDLARAAYKYCPHHVSHYLGMDVHDTPSISRSIKLQPSMVFTIEPGLYVNLNNKSVPKEFRGLGVRIEDDALVKSDNKIQILTESCIKEIIDIER